jgi:hypothetical protein
MGIQATVQYLFGPKATPPKDSLGVAALEAIKTGDHGHFSIENRARGQSDLPLLEQMTAPGKKYLGLAFKAGERSGWLTIKFKNAGLATHLEYSGYDRRTLRTRYCLPAVKGEILVDGQTRTLTEGEAAAYRDALIAKLRNDKPIMMAKLAEAFAAPESLLKEPVSVRAHRDVHCNKNTEAFRVEKEIDGCKHEALIYKEKIIEPVSLTPLNDYRYTLRITISSPLNDQVTDSQEGPAIIARMFDKVEKQREKQLAASKDA